MFDILNWPIWKRRNDDYKATGKVFFFGFTYKSINSWSLEGPMSFEDAKKKLKGAPFDREEANGIYYPHKGELVRVPVKFKVTFENED